MGKILRLLAVLAVALGIGGLATLPVQATDQNPGYQNPGFTRPVSLTGSKTLCPSWQMRSVQQVDGRWVWGDPAAGSQVIDPHKVKLTKPDTPLAGTEFKTDQLTIELDRPTPIRVSYRLSPQASTQGGAVRLFYYHQRDADTMNDPPAGYVAAGGHFGVLTLTAQGQVGTIGLTYDGSNNAAGSVTFAHLQVGHTSLKFAAHPKCTSPSPTPTATPTAVPTATPTATAVPTATATATATAGPGGGGNSHNNSDDELARTGARPWAVAAVGALLLAVGSGALLAGRRRRPKYHQS